MATRADHELQKHTMNFVAGDFEELRRLYPDVEVSALIRELVHDFVTRAKAAESSPKLNEFTLPINIEVKADV